METMLVNINAKIVTVFLHRWLNQTRVEEIYSSNGLEIRRNIHIKSYLLSAKV